MQSIPQIDCHRDGFGKPDHQRPKDGHVPFGPGCSNRQPSLFGQHRVNPPLTDPKNDDHVFPGQQMPMSGFTSVGPVASNSSSSKVHPGSPGFVDPKSIDVQQPGAQANPGLKLPTFEEMLFRCLEVMAQITQQQQQIQQQFQQSFSSAAASAPKNAMAAAPLSSAHPMKEVKQQHFKVKTVPRCDPARCKPAQSQEPWMALSRKKQTANSVTTTWQQIESLPAEIDSKGGSKRDIISYGHNCRNIVRIPERPRQRPGYGHKDSFGQQFLLKQTTVTFTVLVATDVTRRHLQTKVICRIVGHEAWPISKNTAASINQPSPWPPPMHVFCSHGQISNEIGGGRDSRIQISSVKTKIDHQLINRLDRQPLKMPCSGNNVQFHSVRCSSPSQPTVHVQRSACHV